MEVYKITKNLKVILSQFTLRKLVLFDCFILALNLHKSTCNFVFFFFDKIRVWKLHKKKGEGMSLKPKDKNIAEVFKQVDYEIDFYQREYKWNDKELHYKPVQSLLEYIFYRFNLDYKKDLDPTPENLNNYEWYYLNTYITNEINGKKFIVDGQQRLTTLTLIHIVLFHLAKEYQRQHHLIDTLQRSIYDSTDFGVCYCMGVGDRKEAIENLFKNNLSNLKDKSQYASLSERNIYENYQIIVKFLKKEILNNEDIKNKLHFFILYFRNKIYLIEIQIQKSKDVPMVFEVINDRGIPLEPYEILKGKILGQIDKKEIQKYLKIWDKQTNQLAEYFEDHIDFFFSDYFKSKFADNPNQYDELGNEKYCRVIFNDEFNQKINLKHNPKEVKKFIEYDFLYYSQVYVLLLKKYWEYDKDYQNIYFNKLNDIDKQFPLILSALTFNDTQESEKINLVAKLFDRNFVILNLTNSYNSNRFNDSMINLIINIRNKDFESIKASFDKQLLKDIAYSKNLDNIQEPFQYEFFKNVGYENLTKKFLRYFFARVEHYLAENSNQTVKSYKELVEQGGKNAYHIEHILSNNEENLKLFNDEEEFRIQRNRLGGLLLFKGKDNQSSSNETYQEKLCSYGVSGTLFSQTLIENFYKSNVDFKQFIQRECLNFKPYNKFGKDEVEQRQQLLFEVAKKIWLCD